MDLRRIRCVSLIHHLLPICILRTQTQDHEDHKCFEDSYLFNPRISRNYHFTALIELILVLLPALFAAWICAKKYILRLDTAIHRDISFYTICLWLFWVAYVQGITTSKREKREAKSWEDVESASTKAVKAFYIEHGRLRRPAQQDDGPGR